MLQPSDNNLVACGREQCPFPSEGNTESPFPGHFNQLYSRKPFPPEFASGPNSMQHSNRVSEHYIGNLKISGEQQHSFILDNHGYGRLGCDWI